MKKFSIFDIFIICDVSTIYTMNFNMRTYRLIDVYTNTPVILPDNILEELDKHLKMYSEQNNIIPCTACLKGKFVYEDNVIYVEYLHSVMLLDLKATMCYINKDKLIDSVSNNPVHIDHFPTNLNNSFNNYIKSLTKEYNFDFSQNGNDRIMLIGNLNKFDKQIIYDFDKQFLMNTDVQLLKEIYSYIE